MYGREKIIIVENDIPLAARLSLELNRLGYNITGIFSRTKDALHFIEQEFPDLILLDESLKGELNGIESENPKSSKFASPIIYFNKSNPGIIDKLLPETVVNGKKKLKKGLTDSFRKLQKKAGKSKVKNKEHCFLKDRIFIRNRDKMLKLSLDDIRYIEADRNYCRVFTKDRNYLIVTTLKEVDEKLTDKRFLRIHRSYIVNISHIDEIGNNFVVISAHSLPISKNMRQELFTHLQVI
ncbi:LytR/AlgR family response regulator transcription factor [Christiangramia aquimixticola]|uniref:LytR/AlgR family response regulator transcription factor n=1 Tax=Christiangramia aquimixticola TaxID=1697558 RepID=UPI003AA7BDBA